MLLVVSTRSGEVEDTRLEAKAKATKKNPTPRPRTALSRTDPLKAKNRNARDQGHRGGVEDTRPRPRPRTQKKSEAKAKDSLSEDRHSRGQGQECSRPKPRTKDTKRKCSPQKKKVFTKIFQAISKKKKKKKVFTKIFQAISTKKRFPKNFSSAPQNFNNPKNAAVLEPRTGQFSRTWGQGLDLRGQGQGLQNVSSRTSSRPRTSSRTPPLQGHKHNSSPKKKVFKEIF